MRNKLAVATMGTLFCLLCVACGALGSQDALAFNQKIVSENKRVEDAAKAMSDHAHGAGAGNKAELAALKKSHENLKTTLASVKTEIQGLKVPSKQSAKDFHTAEMKYLDGVQKISDDFGEMITVLEDTKTDLAKKLDKLQKIQTRIETAAKADEAALISAQSAFAKDYNITLIK